MHKVHDLVHRRGAEALTMRALAVELGTSTSVIYRHFRSKEALLLSIVDLVLGEVDLAPARASDLGWRKRLEHLSRELRSVLEAHPQVNPIVASYLTVTPNALEVAEVALAILGEAGLSGGEVLHAYNAWAGFVVGFATVEGKPGRAAGRDPAEERVRSYLGSLDGARLPTVTKLMPLLANRAWALRWQVRPLGGENGSFFWGLEVLLDGLAAKVESARALDGP